MKKQEPLEGLWCTFDRIGAGMWIISCWSPEWQVPVGTVWCHAFGSDDDGARDRVEVLHSYVHPRYRRRGVRTFINGEIFNRRWAEVITTQTGSPKEGMPFMLARGYRREPATGLMYVTREAHKAATSGG